MRTVALAISALLTLEGAVALFFPRKAGDVSREFSESGSNAKRALGGFFSAAGLGLLYLTRAYLAVPLVHWVIAVYGIMILIYGLALIISPERSGKIIAWLYAEKGPTSLIGAIISAAGITLISLI